MDRFLLFLVLTIKVVLHSIWIILGHLCFPSTELDWNLFVTCNLTALIQIFGYKRLFEHAFHDKFSVFDAENAIEKWHIFSAKISFGKLQLLFLLLLILILKRADRFRQLVYDNLVLSLLLHGLSGLLPIGYNRRQVIEESVLVIKFK